MRLSRNRRGTRKRRSQEDEDSDRPRINLRVVAVLLILFVFTPIFLKNAAGEPYGLGGLIFWGMWLVISFLAGLYYYAQFLLPIPWYFSWYEGVRLTIRHNFPFFVDFVRSFFIRPKTPAAIPEALPYLPPGFSRHKAGIIQSHLAPVIFKGAAFIKGAGPGFLRLKQGEMIVQVVDLRRHLRPLPVRVYTRDGIMLDTSVTTIFQVKRMADPPDDKWQFPFDQEAIFKVNYLGNFKMEDDTVMPWTDRVPRQAASALIAEVSRYTLDELFQPDESRAAPLEKIKDKITKKITKTFEKYGIEVNFLGVSPFIVPEDIQKERVAIWKSAWQRRIDVEMGSAQAERIRRLKLARARAQIEMIEQLTDGLETIRQSGQDVTDILALRLIEAIEEAESNAAVRALLPTQIANDLKSIRSEVLKEGDEK